METFSADSVLVTFQGLNTHPGFAKGKMINAIKIAADFIHRLPKDGLSPETTEGYEGYVHPYVIDAGVDQQLACIVAALVDDRDVLRGHPDDVPVDLALRVRLGVPP